MTRSSRSIWRAKRFCIFVNRRPIRCSHNLESQRLQYAMQDRLQHLGWREIEVVDDDLGRSAAGMVTRAGFERMVAEVCLGQVGAVAAREVSRFARNSRGVATTGRSLSRRGYRADRSGNGVQPAPQLPAQASVFLDQIDNDLAFPPGEPADQDRQEKFKRGGVDHGPQLISRPWWEGRQKTSAENWNTTGRSSESSCRATWRQCSRRRRRRVAVRRWRLSDVGEMRGRQAMTTSCRECWCGGGI